MVAVAANSVSVFTTDVAPAVGTGIVFDSGLSTVDPKVTDLTGYQVLSVVPNATNPAWFDVTVVSTGRSPVSKKITQAHAQGSIIRGATAPDGNHQSHKNSDVMTAAIIAKKAAILAASNAYAAL